MINAFAVEVPLVVDPTLGRIVPTVPNCKDHVDQLPVLGSWIEQGRPTWCAKACKWNRREHIL